MSGRLRPGDIAAAAGINISPVINEDDLDALSFEVGGPTDGEAVLTGQIDPLYANIEVGATIPAIGELATRAVLAGEGRPEFKNALIVKEVLDDIKAGDIEKALRKISALSDARLARLVTANVKDGIPEYVKKLVRMGSDEQLSETLVFEEARLKAQAMPLEEIQQMMLETVDDMESTQILGSSYDRAMKIALSLRLSSREKRSECIAGICLIGVGDRARTEQQWQQIEAVIQALGVSKEQARRLKDFFLQMERTSWDTTPKYPKEDIRTRITVVLRNLPDL